MKKKKILIMAIVFAGFLCVSTALARNYETWSVKRSISKISEVLTKLTVGNSKNKGKLIVKGEISNTNKTKAVKIKDDLWVTGYLKLDGILQGENAITSDNLGTGIVTGAKLADDSVDSDKITAGAIASSDLADSAVSADKIADDAVTEDKVDFSMDGVVKAAAYGTSATCNSTALTRSFNHLSTSSITCNRAAPGHYTVTFGSDVSERFLQVTPLKSGAVVISVINLISSSTATVYFYDNTGTDTDPTGFFITVY